MDEVVLKDTLNAHWKQTVKSSFGFKMLTKMGWSEEKGLGKEGNGITNYVKISKRDDGLGLGMDKYQDDHAGSKAWGSTISSYNSVLEVLKATYKTTDPTANNHHDNNIASSSEKSKKSKRNKKERKNSSETTDDDEEKEEAENEDSSGKSSKLLPVASSSSTPIKSVGIKYKKFRDSKLLANKSFEDKRAIFGHSGFASIPPIQSNNSLTSMMSNQSSSSIDTPPPKTIETITALDDNNGSIIKTEDESKSGKKKKDKKNKKRKRSEREED